MRGWRRRGRPEGLAVAVALVTLAAACSGSDGQGAARRSAAPAVTSSPVATTAPVASPDQLRPPTAADETASVLTRVERALRSDGLDPAHRLPLGWEQQLAYGALSQHPEWYDAVLAAVPSDVRDAIAANHDAGVQLTSPDLGPTPTSPPDWTILVPPPAAVLVGYYQEAEAQSGIKWQYLAAIHFVETRMGRIHGNSTAGAQGPMQFLPSTWAAYGAGGNIDDNHDAILAAGRFLAATGGTTDIGRALYAYNPSAHYVAAIEDYAGVMVADPRAYDGYYAWQVYVTTTAGTMRLPEGWRRS
jgi:hypothetical protein